MRLFIQRLLTLRLWQFFRISREVGLGLGILLLPVLLLILLSFLEAIYQLESYEQGVVGVFFAFFFLTIHRTRDDLPFFRQFSWPIFKIVGVEYFCLAIPLFIIFAGLGLWWAILTLSICLSGISIYPLTFQKVSNIKPVFHFHFVPALLFEWKSLFRESFFIFLFWMMLGIVGSYWRWVPLVSILLIATFLAKSYQWVEHRSLIAVLGGKSIIWNKGISIFKNFSLIILPIALGFLWWHMAYWYLILWFWGSGLLLLIFALCFKYAFYRPEKTQSFYQIPLGLFAILAVVPFLMPLAVYVLYWLYQKGKLNLQQYYA